MEKSARLAADCITRIVEDLLAAGTMKLAQLHLVPALFAALSIHTVVIQRSDGVQKQLAENRARQCILAFGELAKGWPVAGWILRMFINLMKKLTAGGSTTGAEGRQAVQNGMAQAAQQTNGRAPHPQTHQQQMQQQLQQTQGMNMTSPSRPMDTIPYLPFEHGGQSFVDDGTGGLGQGQQANQFISDIIWAPMQGEFDCDFIFGNTQVSSGLLPFTMG